MSQPPPPDWLDNLIGMRLVAVVFGAAGGTVRALVVKNLSWSQRLSSMMVGALTAGSMGPAVSAITRHQLDWWGFDLSPFEIGGSAVFVTGVCGMTICDAVVRWARRWRDEPPFLPPGGKSP